MNGADPRRVDALFQRALDWPEPTRAAKLDAACGDDHALKSAVLRLLQCERDSLAAFDAAIAGNRHALDTLALELAQASEPAREGQRLGPFRLVRRIGEGGMAVVYLGERDDGAYAQQVAVKILRRSVGDGEDVARFRAERQILSSLEHPHIARLIDGGTTADGLPYLVTEFVEGLPITEYCRTHQLGVLARLTLWLQVVDAVHHAHRKLVVHRDLKPSNVLVDGAGRVRLLDFGIAKGLQRPGDPRAPATRAGLLVMTPEYAAPEQRDGGDITTATDVYQLGVLGFELLTGSRPDGGGDAPPRASTRVARGPLEDDAPPLPRRALARRLRGDIDVILQTALQADPADRYASAAALAADLRNHLRHRPIAARSETTLATLRRLVRRSPLAAASLLALVVLLVSWLVSSHIASRELQRERDLARAQSARAQRTNALLEGLFRRSDPLERDAVGGREATLWASLDASTDTLRANLRDDPQTLADMLDTVARLYRASSRPGQARDVLVEALSLHRRVSGEASAPVAETLGELGSVSAQLGEHRAAAAYLEQAVRIARTLPAKDGAQAVAVFLDAGHTTNGEGDALTALAYFEAAQARLDATAKPDPNARIEALFGLGNTRLLLGKPAQALPPIQRSVALAERLYGPAHARLAGPLSALGNAQRALGRYREAAQSLRRAIAIMEATSGPRDAGVVSARNNLALVLGAAGDLRGEQAELRRLIALKEAASSPPPPSVADNYQNLGASLARSHDHDQALAALAVSQRIYDAVLPPSSPRRAFPRLTRSVVLLDMGRPGDAGPVADQARSILAGTLPAGHFAIGIADCLRAEALLGLGQRDRGLALATQALATVETAPPDQAAYVARCRALTSGSPPPA